MKFSKCLGAFCVVCFICPVIAFGAVPSEKVSGITTSVQQTQPASVVDENTLPITSADVSAAGPHVKTSSSVWIFIRIIIVLAFVLACIYAVVYFMKRGLNFPSDNDPFLRKVSSVSLAPGKSVQVVTLLDNAYIIGVTDNAVNLIGRVTDKELVDAMNLYADKNAKNNKPRNFNDILSLFMPNSVETKTVYGDSANSAAELLKKQRNRLNSGDKK